MNVYNIISSKKSDNDLLKITTQIAEDNPYRALSFAQELVEAYTQALSISPKGFRKVKNSYCYPYKKYLIFYTINEEAKLVNILHIVHASRYSAYQNYL